jgi:hypothetical protein
MQLNKCLILLATCATTAFSVAVPDAAAADECSNLGGVMSMEAHKLPEGVSLSDLRKCVEHPHGRERFLDEASLAPFEEGDAPSDEKKKKNSTDIEAGGLEERAADACYTAAPYGCSRGYCWKTCGDNGKWCWTAYKAGLGSWIKCSTYNDCGTTTYACGIGGVSGGCGC